MGLSFESEPEGRALRVEDWTILRKTLRDASLNKDGPEAHPYLFDVVYIV